ENKDRMDKVLYHPVELRWADYDPQKREAVPISAVQPGHALMLVLDVPEDAKYLCVGGVSETVRLVNLASFRGCVLWVKVIAKDQNAKATEQWFQVAQNEEERQGICHCFAQAPTPEVLAAARGEIEISTCP